MVIHQTQLFLQQKPASHLKRWGGLFPEHAHWLVTGFLCKSKHFDCKFGGNLNGYQLLWKQNCRVKDQFLLQGVQNVLLTDVGHTATAVLCSCNMKTFAGQTAASNSPGRQLAVKHDRMRCRFCLRDSFSRGFCLVAETQAALGILDCSNFKIQQKTARVCSGS